MHILFVDDDSLNRRVVKDMLATAGVEMAEAPEAASGLRMLEERSFDLVLMDLRMPGMDGLEAIRVMRRRPGPGGATPVILLTADTSLDLEERSRAAGANSILRKPVMMTALFDAVAELIAGGSASPTLD